MSKLCTIEGCNKPLLARGWCGAHWARWRKTGSPTTPFVCRRPGEGGINGDGYLLMTTKDGKRKFDHVLVAEKILGKELPKGAVIHHINENRTDNRPENLLICPSRAYHFLIHQRMRALDSCGHADWLKCSNCCAYDDPKNLSGTGVRRYHKECAANYQYQRRHGHPKEGGYKART